MASNMNTQTCAKCTKATGSALCQGCQQSFCMKHFLEHRQELSDSIDIVGQEHDLLRRDMTMKSNTPLLLERINQWEKETIENIHRYANQIRYELEQSFDRTRHESEMSVNKLADELRACRESNDYTEIDIQRWNEQLRNLRQTILHSSNLHIQQVTIPETDIPWIRLSNNPNIVTQSNERFSEYYGMMNISNDGLQALCIGTRWDDSCVSGTGRYSTGFHPVRLRIENKQSNFLFFGIITATQDLSRATLNAESLNGWWNLNYNIVSGKSRDTEQTNSLDIGDEITLILDCDHRLIRLEHRRLNRTVELPVDINCCPFPWKIIVRLSSAQDAVRIL